jgi:hypothetical protein
MTQSKVFDPEDHLHFEPEQPRGDLSSIREELVTEVPPKVKTSEETPPHDEEDLSQEKIGRLIAEKMQDHGFHPVVIFGSPYSGKSTMLQSLFGYLMTEVDQGVGIYLDESMIPEGTAYGRFARDSAHAFFYRGMQEFIDGKGEQKTRARAPFFIPVRIVPPNKPEVRIAFMESDGEWYKPEKDTARYYKELREEINGILLNYQRGITFLHVAPYTQLKTWTSERGSEEQNKQEIRDADSALVGALNSYESVRPFKTDDSHMMIMTKWDARKPDGQHGTLEEALSNVSDTTLSSALVSQYQQGFSVFNSLKVPKERKRLMRYCAGIMQEREVVPPKTPELQAALNEYRKNLWNWIYSNATRTNPDVSKSMPLFDPPKPKPMGPIGILIVKLTKAIERLF